MPATATISSAHILSRVLASLLGGWVFVWGCATLGVGLAVLAGVSYSEALELAYLLAFLLFLAVFCWAFAAASLLRVWLVLGGGGALMSVVAWAITRTH
ncbi:MAG: iron uptake protein [Steroidobacter sp.]